MEELNLRIEVLDHFYTTDFYQESAFRKDDQIISIYYFIRQLGEINLETVHIDTIKDFLSYKNPHADQESFCFIPFGKFSDSMLSFPIDKVVGKMLMEYFEKNNYVRKK